MSEIKLSAGRERAREFLERVKDDVIKERDLEGIRVYLYPGTGYTALGSCGRGDQSDRLKKIFLKYGKGYAESFSITLESGLDDPDCSNVGITLLEPSASSTTPSVFYSFVKAVCAFHHPEDLEVNTMPSSFIALPLLNYEIAANKRPTILMPELINTHDVVTVTGYKKTCGRTDDIFRYLPEYIKNIYSHAKSWDVFHRTLSGGRWVIKSSEGQSAEAFAEKLTELFECTRPLWARAPRRAGSFLKQELLPVISSVSLDVDGEAEKKILHLSKHLDKKGMDELLSAEVEEDEDPLLYLIRQHANENNISKPRKFITETTLYNVDDTVFFYKNAGWPRGRKRSWLPEA